MTCDEVLARLTAWRDGELPVGEEADQMGAHLALCQVCAHLCAEMGRVAMLAQTWTVEGADIWEEVQTEIMMPSLDDVLSELRKLRAEVTELRQQLSARPAPVAPEPLSPYIAPSKSARLIV